MTTVGRQRRQLRRAWVFLVPAIAALLGSFLFLPLAHTVAFQIGRFSIAGWWEPVEVIRQPFFPLQGNPALGVAMLARRGMHTLQWRPMSLAFGPNVGHSVRVGWLTWAIAWTYPDDRTFTEQPAIPVHSTR